MTRVKEKLLETLKDLSDREFEQFKQVLQCTVTEKGLSYHLEKANRGAIMELMVEIYGQQCVETTREVLKKINRRDRVERLSETSSSGSKEPHVSLQGPSRSLELKGCGSIMQGSNDWTKLEPEVSSTDGDEAPTYSLQSEAGNFECSVSGMRWVCKEKISFKFQFCSTEDHMERIERIHYMPAGPLLDVTIIAGKFFEVYLPHWIRIDNNPKILDKFAVLHIDDGGDAVEKVSEVTSSHVKLSEPVFSLKMALVRYGFSVEINCKVLIYKTKTPFLQLHVYLIPPDPALQQELDKKELSYGYKGIPKPHPEKSLKMNDTFILTADVDGAEIYPETLMLRYESTDPNFFEVFIKNPDTDFVLKLEQQNGHLPVWNCVLRTDEYQSTTHLQAAVSSTGPCECATGGVEATGGQSPIPGPSGRKHSVDDHEPAQMQKAEVIKVKILRILADLDEEGFEDFKWLLQNGDIGPGLERIPKFQLEGSKRSRVVDLMWETYVQQSVEVTRKVLENMKKRNLAKKLQDTS